MTETSLFYRSLPISNSCESTSAPYQDEHIVIISRFIDSAGSLYCIPIELSSRMFCLFVGCFSYSLFSPPQPPISILNVRRPFIELPAFLFYSNHQEILSSLTKNKGLRTKRTHKKKMKTTNIKVVTLTGSGRTLIKILHICMGCECVSCGVHYESTQYNCISHV